MRITHVIAGVFCLLAPAFAFAATFSFDELPVYVTTTPFGSTADGITASFSSPIAGAFVIAPVDGFVIGTLSGQLLQDADPTAHRLDIAFSQPLQAIALLFAMNGDWTTDRMFLEAWLGFTFVGATSESGTVVVPGGLPEGTLTFNGGVFDSVRLTSSAADFAIDNLDATSAAPVPEPASFVFSISALTGLLLIGKRLRSR